MLRSSAFRTSRFGWLILAAFAFVIFFWLRTETGPAPSTGKRTGTEKGQEEKSGSVGRMENAIRVDTWGCSTFDAMVLRAGSAMPSVAGCVDLDGGQRVIGPLETKSYRSKYVRIEYARIEVPGKGELWTYFDHLRGAETSFSNLSYPQHLAAAQQAAKPTATIYQIDEGLRHLEAIPPSASVEGVKAKALEQHLRGLRKKRQEELSLIEAKVKRVFRDKMAKTIENSMLDKGNNVDVSAIGQDHTVLHLKWVLVSKVMAHQLEKQGDFFENARKVGFKRVEITDGFKETWYWDLH